MLDGLLSAGGVALSGGVAGPAGACAAVVVDGGTATVARGFTFSGEPSRNCVSVFSASSLDVFGDFPNGATVSASAASTVRFLREAAPQQRMAGTRSET